MNNSQWFNFKVQLINIMAKLQKSFQDYFRIPVLLRSIGKTEEQKVFHLQKIMSKADTTIILDERYQRDKNDSFGQILSHRPQSVNVKLYFRRKQFDNNWPQFQIVYWCRFVIGVLDTREENDIESAIRKAKKIVKDQNKRLIGIIICGDMIPNTLDMDMIFLPQKIPQTQIWSFLQPNMYTFLKTIEEYLIKDISELKSQNNEVIVFNKNQQRPDPKTLKKKRKGRCYKLMGDYYLMLGLTLEAYKSFLEAEEILKKIDDYVWLLGCLQGKMACMTSDCELPVSEKYEQFRKLAVQSKQVAKKSKIWSLECQNNFKIFRIFQNQAEYLDELISTFLNQNQRNNIQDDLFNIFLQIGVIYENANRLRKRNYFYYHSAILYYQKKPEFSVLLFKEIKNNKSIKQWPELYSKLIKLIIDAHLTDFNGQLHLELLQNCCSRLTKKDIEITTDTLNFNNSLPVLLNRSTPLFTLLNIRIIQSLINPKPNRLVQPKQQNKKGFFMSWKKKQERLLFQFRENIKIEGTFYNPMPFPMRIKVSLPLTSLLIHQFVLYLPNNSNTSFSTQFQVKEEHTDTKLIDLSKIEISTWNFTFIQTLPTPLQLEIYNETPIYSIEMNDILTVEKSSPFQFQVKLKKLKENLKCFKVRINVSVYYHIDVGFQQNQYVISDCSQCLRIRESGQKQQRDPQILYLAKFRDDRKYLKKIQITVDYITSQNDKYQITTTLSSNCKLIESIWCQIVSLENPNLEKYLQIPNFKSKRLIQDQYVLTFRLHKNPLDLVPYKVFILSKEYTLSSDTLITIQQTLPKQIGGSDIKLQISWVNMTESSQKGYFNFVVPYSQILTKCNKEVNMKVKSIIQCQNQTRRLIIEYEVKGINLSHRIGFHPIIYQQKKQFILNGKNRVKNNSNAIKNKIQVLFYTKYPQKYIVEIVFDDGLVYYYPDIISADSRN